MKVRFAREARADLLDIAEYIAADSPVHARRVASGLEAKAGDLAFMAERHPVVGTRGLVAVRRFVHESYSIFYSVDGPARSVTILRILHTARDHERILFGDG